MIRIALCALLVLSCAGEALAHADGFPVGPNELWHHWSFDPLVWAPLLLAHWLYGRGVLRAWARAGQGRIMPAWRVGCFIAGEALLAAALVAPLDPLGETLLSAHMAQHIVLTSLAPPLLVLGAPVTAWTWALPPAWRCLGRLRAVRFVGRFWYRLSRPVTATALHALALWVWHAPAAFEIALRNEWAHRLEHLCFLVTALLFWTAAFSRKTAPITGALCVLVTFVQCGLLGAAFSLATHPLYLAYGDRARLWGISPLEDQQIAGLLMWAPAGLAYFVAFMALASRVFTHDPRGRAVV